MEHDLRYKCQDDWEPFPAMSRTFNGILAALETHEWSIIQLFERLSYNHYQNGNISAMIRTKLRVRCSNYDISTEVELILIQNESIVKEIFKINRNDILQTLLSNKPLFPLTIDNLVYLINCLFIGNKDLIAITPEFILEELKQAKIEGSKENRRITSTIGLE